MSTVILLPNTKKQLRPLRGSRLCFVINRPNFEI